jgi:hypothetical protein
VLGLYDDFWFATTIVFLEAVRYVYDAEYLGSTLSFFFFFFFLKRGAFLLITVYGEQ